MENIAKFQVSVAKVVTLKATFQAGLFHKTCLPLAYLFQQKFKMQTLQCLAISCGDGSVDPTKYLSCNSCEHCICQKRFFTDEADHNKAGESY